MFLKQSFNIFEDYQKNLQTIDNSDKIQADQDIKQAALFLSKAAALLDEIGFVKEAENVTSVLEDCSLADDGELNQAELLLQRLMDGLNKFLDYLNSPTMPDQNPNPDDPSRQEWVAKVRESINDEYADFIDKKIDSKKMISDLEAYILYLNQLSQKWYNRKFIN